MQITNTHVISIKICTLNIWRSYISIIIGKST
jgi:hypothetical protein